jgi:thiamine-phosphate pyrophosphorylase
MHRFAKPIVCYVTDRNSLPLNHGGSPERMLLDRIRMAVVSGVDWIQIREKDLNARALLDLSRAAMSTCQNAAPPARTNSTRIILNDRADVAWAAPADGVHLGQTSVPLRATVDANALLRTNPADFLVGRSCHSLEEVMRAAEDLASYVFFGPVFHTPSKAAFGPPQGLSRLAAVCRAVPIPVIAIGGITVENAPECVQNGAAGVAAIRLFQQNDRQAASFVASFKEQR